MLATSSPWDKHLLVLVHFAPMSALTMLNNEIVACTCCPRLVAYREAVARDKRRQFREWSYWGKPVPGFGDSNARLYILGLAPAAHGGTEPDAYLPETVVGIGCMKRCTGSGSPTRRHPYMRVTASLSPTAISARPFGARLRQTSRRRMNSRPAGHLSCANYGY